jgi:hypothetical protein
MMITDEGGGDTMVVVVIHTVSVQSILSVLLVLKLY